MSDSTLRARTTSEIVDAAFALYRRHSGQYIIVTALAHVPALILQIVLQGSVTDPASPQAIINSLIVLPVSLVTQSIMSGVVMTVGAQVYLGGEPDAGAAVTQVLPRLPSLIAASLMKAILYFLGALLFFVGAIYVALRYFAIDAAVVLEKLGPSDAFTRSSVLSAGRKRHVFNTLALVYLIYLLILVGVTAFAGIADSPIVTIIASALATIVVYPVLSLTTMVLYYDTRIRNEGFDLEQMEAALGPTAPAATRV